ncbi:related to ATP-dependent RNA helicase SUV3, mitochondrial [Saccharomycodes ludwigii]|uniref:ATP-dependent RNA helicase SUV3, mitochondrial n=1 Tax=Saccharomycodes ludwigii TaxID=36035 RepID=A0A376B1P7_9ASCO|nr:hypothetical protein SCDLUD_001948 [Saccharomycodes ludwigii]KAH3902135.1 hypothetical protein SCDLUD_001948 [Saccharomycodes ludwigii]SSD58605.1 related to ATP-dependent RNA helicase SUV3, mitochondrial [Saccharomycodes ludwigii]
MSITLHHYQPTYGLFNLLILRNIKNQLSCYPFRINKNGRLIVTTTRISHLHSNALLYNSTKFKDVKTINPNSKDEEAKKKLIDIQFYRRLPTFHIKPLPTFNNLTIEEKLSLKKIRFPEEIESLIATTCPPGLLTEIYEVLKNIHDKYLLNKTTQKENQVYNAAWWKLRDYLFGSIKMYHNSTNTPVFVNIGDYVKFSDINKIYPMLLQSNILSNEKWYSLITVSPMLNSRILKPEQVTSLLKVKYILQRAYLKILHEEIESKTPKIIYENKNKLPKLGLKDSGSNTLFDIKNPADWFYKTRKMKRKIIMHLGPTNSGKTYNALQKLKKSNRGYYAGPLRLLAREVYERFQKEGIRCNLLTGEEIINDLDSMGNQAGLTSGTVEMVPLTQEFDIVVLDEIQMMGDPDRGWAWTNAVLGCNSKELHLCGEKSVLPLIRKIAAITGDELIINEYARLGELRVETSPIPNGLRSLQKGDCLVAFSKKKIIDLKLKIEQETTFKVAVIYGSLPPETRIQQANLFNEGRYDVLVASDAIGMGLNLAINRVIFTTDSKFNGEEMVLLTTSNIKQIGGRAGRFKSHEEGPSVGYVTATSKSVLENVRSGINAKTEYLNKAYVWPPDQLASKMIKLYPPNISLSFFLNDISLQIEKNATKIFALSDLRNRLEAISLFEHVSGLTFQEKMILSNAPVKSLPAVQRAYVNFCKTIANKQTKNIFSYQQDLEPSLLEAKFSKKENIGLDKYENIHSILSLFFWLGNRWPNYFVDPESATDLKHLCELIIFDKLDSLTKNPYLKKNAIYGSFFSKSFVGNNKNRSGRTKN